MPFRHSLLRSSLCILPLVGGILEPGLASAQAPDACPSASPSGKARATHESSGIRAAINNISSRNAVLSIQLILQNTTKSRQYLVAYGPYSISFDSGVLGNYRQFTGLGVCNFNPDVAVAAKQCRDDKSKNLDNFTYIEPCEFTTATLDYNISDQNGFASAHSVSFSINMFARAASGDVDALSPADSAKAVGAPRSVTINFPLTPLKDD